MVNEKALHYLKVLKKNSTVYQPEIRDAIDRGIVTLDAAVKFERDVRKQLSAMRKRENKEAIEKKKENK